MAETRKQYTGQQYYAQHQGDSGNIPSDFKGLGYYSRTSLEDIINNFIVAYIGEDKALPKIPRYELDFWAQRAMQEFSYDVLHSEKSMELDLGDSLQFPLPQDYVNYIKISCVGTDGVKKVLLPQRRSGDPTAPLQDNNSNITFDGQGKIVTIAKSTLATRFQDASNTANTLQSAQDYYYSNYNNDNFSYFNKRYGGVPEDMNAAGTYFIDHKAGLIFFDGSFANRNEDIVVLDYISDGLDDNADLDKVYMPKLAEDAAYAYMLYNLAKVRPSIAQLVPLYKKEATAKLRNAKIRLSNYKLEELAQILRGKSKWIKH